MRSLSAEVRPDARQVPALAGRAAIGTFGRRLPLHNPVSWGKSNL